MPYKRYAPEEIIKVRGLVEIEAGQVKTTAQAVKILGIMEQSYYRWHNELHI